MNKETTIVNEISRLNNVLTMVEGHAYTETKAKVKQLTRELGAILRANAARVRAA